MDFQDLLLRIVIALPFGVGAVTFCVFGIKRFERFFFMDYQGNSNERFKDNLIGNLFIGLGVGCLLAAVFAYQEGKLSWSLLPLALCFGGLVIPVGVLGAYGRSYQANKLWGGLMPIVREKYGYAQPETANQHKIDPSKIKIPRRTMLTAFLLALLVFFGMYFLLAIIGWNGSVLSGILFRLFVSGLLAFGIFMTIGSASLSRRIQKMREGEPLDDEDDF
jgi:predicted membrane chloride channel (bestrophin family)